MKRPDSEVIAATLMRRYAKFGAEVSEQRLVQREQQLGAVLRDEPLEARVRDEAVVGEVDREVAAGAQRLAQAHVGVEVARDAGPDAGERRRVRLLETVLVDGEAEDRIEHRLGGANVLELPERRQPLRRDAGVVLERLLHRLGKRQAGDFAVLAVNVRHLGGHLGDPPLMNEDRGRVRHAAIFRLPSRRRLGVDDRVAGGAFGAGAVGVASAGAVAPLAPRAASPVVPAPVVPAALSAPSPPDAAPACA